MLQENPVKGPLILTLSIEQETHLYFNALRQQYFPRDRNFIDAHLTLFHALPNNDLTIAAVQDCSLSQAPFSLHVTALVSIGRGVAYKIESGELMRLHKTLQDNWLQVLSPQDRQKIWPHITIQNKVPPLDAQLLLKQLQHEFKPFFTRATGLQLWEYLGGPWKPVKTFSFACPGQIALHETPVQNV